MTPPTAIRQPRLFAGSVYVRWLAPSGRTLWHIRNPGRHNVVLCGKRIGTGATEFRGILAHDTCNKCEHYRLLRRPRGSCQCKEDENEHRNRRNRQP